MPANQMVQPPRTGVAVKKCRRAAALISQQADRPLTRAERLTLRLHLSACPQCREYARQLALIQRAAKKFEP